MHKKFIKKLLTRYLVFAITDIREGEMPREIEGELEMKLANEMMEHMDGEPCVEDEERN